MGFRQRIDQVQTIAEFALHLLRERVESGVVFFPMQKHLRADPHPYYRRLRERDPVHRSRLADGWVLSRHEDVLGVLRDPSWSSDERNWNRYGRYRARGARAGIPDPYEEKRASMLRIDPPDHTRLRSLVSKAFTPRAVEAMRPRIALLVDELLGKVEAQRRMELVGDLAAPLPVIVIAEMLGVPAAEHQQFRRLSDEAVRLLGDGTMAEKKRGVAGMHALSDYFAAIVEARRAAPQPDLISGLVAAEEAGDRLSLAEMLATLVLLLVAGNETTTKLIGNAVVALLRNPDQYERLRADPGLMTNAVEEFLRYDGPVQLTSRMALADRPLCAGRSAKKGQQIVLLLAAANRDPEVFPEPDRLDVARPDVRHLAFGQGIHFCLGAQLARLEAALALEAVVTRFPGLRLADPAIRWSSNTILRGPEALQLAW
jgi:cytochrome P450